MCVCVCVCVCVVVWTARLVSRWSLFWRLWLREDGPSSAPSTSRAPNCSSSLTRWQQVLSINYQSSIMSHGIRSETFYCTTWTFTVHTNCVCVCVCVSCTSSVRVSVSTEGRSPVWFRTSENSDSAAPPTTTLLTLVRPARIHKSTHTEYYSTSEVHMKYMYITFDVHVL